MFTFSIFHAVVYCFLGRSLLDSPCESHLPEEDLHEIASLIFTTLIVPLKMETRSKFLSAATMVSPIRIKIYVIIHLDLCMLGNFAC